MKTKVKQEMRSQTVPELVKKRNELQDSLAKLRVNAYTKPPKNTHERKGIRHMIALIETICGEKMIEEKG